MKKSLISLLHLGFWLGYFLCLMFLMFAISQFEDVQPEDYSYYFTFFLGAGILPPLVSFYGNYHYLFERYLQKQKWGLAVLSGLGIAALAVGAGFLAIVLGNETTLNCVREGFPYSAIFTFAIAVVFGVIGVVLKGFLTWLEELKLKEELVEKTHKMELALVKSQLDPHFLFNTINNIDILITKDPEEASHYLNKLSDMMRFMLYETKAEAVPLEQELAYIERYVELQRIRTSNRHYVQFAIEGQPQDKKVAPMIFIPFIENAFKHATNKKIPGAVDIGIHIDENRIQFRCQNKFDQHRPPQNGANGLGNELIERRLQLLYPNTHTLAVERQNEEYSVELTLLHEAV